MTVIYNKDLCKFEVVNTTMHLACEYDRISTHVDKRDGVQIATRLNEIVKERIIAAIKAT